MMGKKNRKIVMNILISFLPGKVRINFIPQQNYSKNKKNIHPFSLNYGGNLIETMNPPANNSQFIANQTTISKPLAGMTGDHENKQLTQLLNPVIRFSTAKKNYKGGHPLIINPRHIPANLLPEDTVRILSYTNREEADKFIQFVRDELNIKIPRIFCNYKMLDDLHNKGKLTNKNELWQIPLSKNDMTKLIAYGVNLNVNAMNTNKKPSSFNKSKSSHSYMKKKFAGQSNKKPMLHTIKHNTIVSPTPINSTSKNIPLHLHSQFENIVDKNKGIDNNNFPPSVESFSPPPPYAPGNEPPYQPGLNGLNPPPYAPGFEPGSQSGIANDIVEPATNTSSTKPIAWPASPNDSTQPPPYAPIDEEDKDNQYINKTGNSLRPQPLIDIPRNRDDDTYDNRLEGEQEPEFLSPYFANNSAGISKQNMFTKVGSDGKPLVPFQQEGNNETRPEPMVSPHNNSNMGRSYTLQ